MGAKIKSSSDSKLVLGGVIYYLKHNSHYTGTLSLKEATKLWSYLALFSPGFVGWGGWLESACTQIKALKNEQ